MQIWQIKSLILLKFTFLHEIFTYPLLICCPNQVKNELPSTFKTYRNQQHRWSCGPANLFRKMAMEIVRCKVITFIVFTCILWDPDYDLNFIHLPFHLTPIVHCRKSLPGRSFILYTVSSLFAKS